MKDVLSIDPTGWETQPLRDIFIQHPRGTLSSSHPRKINRTSGNFYPFALTFCFIYVILKYMMFIEKRKPIIVAAQNVTLFAKLSFFPKGRLTKKRRRPLTVTVFSANPDVTQNLHKCNILRRILLKSELYPNFSAENAG